LNVPQLRDKIQLYTYASPRVGDLTFAKLHSQYIPNSYRIVNLADFIPLMPPTQAVGTYLHVGQEWSFLSQNGDFMPNHVVDTYRVAVEREVETDSSRSYPVSGLA
jgi:predicted lipase